VALFIKEEEEDFLIFLRPTGHPKIVWYVQHPEILKQARLMKNENLQIVGHNA